MELGANQRSKTIGAITFVAKLRTKVDHKYAQMDIFTNKKRTRHLLKD